MMETMEPEPTTVYKTPRAFKTPVLEEREDRENIAPPTAARLSGLKRAADQSFEKLRCLLSEHTPNRDAPAAPVAAPRATPVVERARRSAPPQRRPASFGGRTERFGPPAEQRRASTGRLAAPTKPLEASRLPVRRGTARRDLAPEHASFDASVARKRALERLAVKRQTMRVARERDTMAAEDRDAAKLREREKRHGRFLAEHESRAHRAAPHAPPAAKVPTCVPPVSVACAVKAARAARDGRPVEFDAALDAAGAANAAPLEVVGHALDAANSAPLEVVGHALDAAGAAPLEVVGHALSVAPPPADSADDGGEPDGDALLDLELAILGGDADDDDAAEDDDAADDDDAGGFAGFDFKVFASGTAAHAPPKPAPSSSTSHTKSVRFALEPDQALAPPSSCESTPLESLEPAEAAPLRWHQIALIAIAAVAVAFGTAGLSHLTLRSALGTRYAAKPLWRGGGFAPRARMNATIERDWETVTREWLGPWGGTEVATPTRAAKATPPAATCALAAEPAAAAPAAAAPTSRFYGWW